MSWQADVLGAGYEQQVLELGPDPGGEGEAVAVLVRRTLDAWLRDHALPG